MIVCVIGKVESVMFGKMWDVFFDDFDLVGCYIVMNVVGIVEYFNLSWLK